VRGVALRTGLDIIRLILASRPCRTLPGPR
jgi:hypothetical protein